MTEKQIRVAVVNHQATFLRLMEQILTGEGYATTVHSAADDAHGAITRLQPDVIIVDTWLQTRDEGWELVQTLRLDEKTRHIPIILASSDAERVQERSEQLSGMKNVLILGKPFDPESLLRSVARVTGTKANWDAGAQASLDSPK
ncbi:MAG: response regulator [Chloroflexota bacterium]